MRHHAPTGVRRYRPRAITPLLLGVIVSVALATSASTMPTVQTTLISAPASAGRAVTTTIAAPHPSQYAFVAAARAASRAARASAPLVTTTAVWGDKKSVRAGGSVKFTGQVSYGAAAGRVRAQVVNLQVKSGDSWKDVSSRTASANGYVGFTVKPTTSSSYRLSFPGAPALAASVSPATTVRVTNAAGSAPPRARVSTSPPSAVPAGNSVAASGRGAQVLAAAVAQSGKPYRYGAAGPNAFDCSGLTQYAYRTVGITLPHSADGQKGYGRAVSRAAALPGDLIVFLDGGYGYHAAIYAGGGYMYDAPNSGSTVGRHKIYSGTVIFRRLV